MGTHIKHVFKSLDITALNHNSFEQLCNAHFFPCSSKKTYHFGDTVVIPTTPTKPATDKYTYTSILYPYFELCKKYKENATVINAVESHHGDVEPQTLVACIVQAADTISAARPGARRETLEAYTNRLKQLEDIANSFKGVDKSFAIQAGREVRVMVVPEQVSDDDLVLLARDLSKKIESELEYPGQIKINVVRETKATDYAK